MTRVSFFKILIVWFYALKYRLLKHLEDKVFIK